MKKEEYLSEAITLVSALLKIDKKNKDKWQVELGRLGDENRKNIALRHLVFDSHSAAKYGDFLSQLHPSLIEKTYAELNRRTGELLNSKLDYKGDMRDSITYLSNQLRRIELFSNLDIIINDHSKILHLDQSKETLTFAIKTLQLKAKLDELQKLMSGPNAISDLPKHQKELEKVHQQANMVSDEIKSKGEKVHDSVHIIHSMLRMISRDSQPKQTPMMSRTSTVTMSSTITAQERPHLGT